LISLETALVRLGLSVVLGALVGLEREQGERAAGIRTLTLVALGSCLICVVHQPPILYALKPRPQEPLSLLTWRPFVLIRG
jgi:uncharacterized membrane protein YhiD involved in acid resistance